MDYALIILALVIGFNLGFLAGAWFCQHMAKRRGY